MSENEPLWEQYRKERDGLLDILAFKEVWGWVDDKVPDEAIKDLPSCETLRNARQFLEDTTGSHYVRIPNMYFVDACVEFHWTMSEDKQLTVIFYPDNQWSVSLEKRVHEGEGPDPSFWIDEKDGSKTPHFFLNDKILAEIEKPQPWSQTYEPLLSHLKIVWSTGYWDGPLSGYCCRSHNVNELHYFCCVEEMVYSPQLRMYAVYELSDKEQVDAWAGHGRWLAILKCPWKWWLYLFFWKYLRSHNYEEHAKQHEQWKKDHKLLGYFTN
jgi:hypothetical protein